MPSASRYCWRRGSGSSSLALLLVLVLIHGCGGREGPAVECRCSDRQNQEGCSGGFVTDRSSAQLATSAYLSTTSSHAYEVDIFCSPPKARELSKPARYRGVG